MADAPFRLFESIDYEELVEEYPPPPEFLDDLYYASREEIREIQEERLQAKLEQAYEIPFYRRLWDEAGVTPDDVDGLEDLHKIPTYTVEDLRDSMDRDPPMGDYQGPSLHDPDDAPLRLFTSGGTTGEPRPQLYTAYDREVQAIQFARSYWMQGLRPGDVLQNTSSFSLHNAAWITDRGIYNWLGATGINTGTGQVTPSDQQVKYASKWGTDALLSHCTYLIKLAQVAEEEGYDLQEDFDLTCLPTYGVESERELVEELWDVPVYNNYGFHEVGTIAAECEHQDGMHVFEDIVIVQIVDPETGEEVEPGEQGEIVVTELYKTGTPQVRYNIKDISVLMEGDCDCGSNLRRLEDFLGRGDNMVKVRGVNVWPEAVGRIIADHEDTTGEYFTYADKDPDTMLSEMTALVERRGDATLDDAALKAELEQQLKSELTVRIDVEIREAESLAEITEIEGTKIRRFEDRR